MAQVSRRYVRPGVQKKLQELLIGCIDRCRDQQTTISFLEDLLTDTEKTMLAKRIAIALMILKGKSYEEIDQTLKVSTATIWKVKEWLNRKGDGFRTLLQDVMKHDERQTSRRQDALRDALEEQPPRRRDWSTYKKGQWQHVRETPDEPF